MTELTAVYITSPHYFHTFREFLVKEDTHTFSTCSSFLYHYLVSLNRLDWLDEITLTSFDRGLFSYRPLQESLAITASEAALFAFPIDEADKPHFHQICNAFSFFIHMQKDPFVQRLERMLDIYHQALPIHTLQSMISFLITCEKTESIRTLFSDKIRDFLRKER